MKSVKVKQKVKDGTRPGRKPLIGYYNYTVILTYLSVVSAIIGICFATRGYITNAIILLMLCGLFDMFDGAVARKRKRTSEEKAFGIQIDSLADVIAFGVFPAMIGYSLGLDKGWQLAILALYVLAALSRLAYFNVTEELRQNQTTEKRKYYEGLPVTNVALILPAVYGFNQMLGEKFAFVYLAALICLSLAFVLKIKVKKITGPGLLVLIGLGLAEVIWVLL